jgi:hypothetical protein
MPFYCQRLNVARTNALAALALTVVACSSPTQPGVSVAASRPLGPTTGTQVSYYSQPVTLRVSGGTTTGSGAPVTTLEVATDAAFSTILMTLVPTANASGELTVTLDHLAPSTTYYWRTRTTAGNNPGAVSSAASFSIGPQLIIQPPVAVQPLADTFPHKRPTFVVANATHTGPSATLTYHFEVATDSTFSSLIASGTVAESATQTSFTPASDLMSGTTYYWRAQARDTTTGVTGPYSSAQAFATVFPEDGSSRYTLAIQAPTYCLTHSIHTGSAAFPAPNWNISHFTFGGTSTVAGDTLRFTPDPQFAPDSALPTIPSLLGFSRAHSHVEGSISGSTSYPLVGSAPFFSGVIFKGVVAGSSDNGGQFEGTFDGAVTLDREGFPNYSRDTCSTPGFTWTLMPR